MWGRRTLLLKLVAYFGVGSPACDWSAHVSSFDLAARMAGICKAEAGAEPSRSPHGGACECPSWAGERTRCYFGARARACSTSDLDQSITVGLTTLLLLLTRCIRHVVPRHCTHCRLPSPVPTIRCTSPTSFPCSRSTSHAPLPTVALTTASTRAPHND